MPFRTDHSRHFGWAAIPCACLCVAAAPASAQILDRIEISRMNGSAEIRIDFAVQVQYLRHTPPGKGRELSIFVKPINAPTPESEPTQEMLPAPKTDLVPAFTVLYPHLGNAIAIRFDQETSWDVRPGADGRSISIVVPILRGARDVSVEARAIPQPPRAAVASAPVVPRVAATTAVEAPAAAVLAAAATPAPLAAAKTATPATPEVAQPTPQPVEPAAPAEASAPVSEPTTPTYTPEQIESMAKGFMDDARKALDEKDLPRAINRLNRTLGLPPNAQTEQAQAMVGDARSANGEILKARAEYDLYLKLYPKGRYAKQVIQNLAKLPKEETRAQQARNRPLQRGPAEWMVYGSMAQGYYTGKSHIEITTPPPPGLLDFTTDTLSMTDQKALITTLDANARRRDGVTDTRIVFRDTDTQNYLNKSRSYNRLYAAYFEQSDKELGYFVRVGRQNPTGSGVLEKFDGINAGYTFADHWRANAVAGYAVEFMSPFQRNFYGASIEMQPRPESIGLTAYAIRQNLDGVLNRQAVGLESRYFDMHTTVFGMLDYDTLYKGVNIAMLQGNYRTDDGTNVFTYLDHRKTPAYSLTNTYMLWNGMTVKDAIAAVGLEQMRADARALTATSNLISIGATHPVTQHWQVGLDYRAASISSTGDTWTYATIDNPIPQQIAGGASTGTNHVIGAQAIGTGLWNGNDVAVINGNYIKGATYSGEALGGNFIHMIGDDWRFDLNLRYYQQKDNADETQKRLNPALKVGYKWRFATIEGEAGQEYVRRDSPTTIERTSRTYFYLGYRLDLR